MVPRTLSLALLSILSTACASLGAAGAPQSSAAVVVNVDTVRPSDATALTTLSAAEAASSPAAADGWAPGDRVEVEWRGSWWPAVLVERRGQLWLIHYEAYGDEWDEAVAESRIRPPKASLEPEEPEDETDP
jgi:hypothetical protein